MNRSSVRFRSLAPFFCPFSEIRRENCSDITSKKTFKIKFCRHFCVYIAALLDWLVANRNSHFLSVFFARMGKKHKTARFCFIRRQACFIKHPRKSNLPVWYDTLLKIMGFMRIMGTVRFDRCVAESILPVR